MREDKAVPDDHDTWFRGKGQEALEDRRPNVPHAEVMREMRELIGRT